MPVIAISTHSRPKAAGYAAKHGEQYSCNFNTQPPEGGWAAIAVFMAWYSYFNTQPPEGGWRHTPTGGPPTCYFNTQPPEGGWVFFGLSRIFALISTHSRPTAAGEEGKLVFNIDPISTHSRPKAAGPKPKKTVLKKTFQHTAARRRLVPFGVGKSLDALFQHTAARRRLGKSSSR